ncbi:MAG: hypothetical protein JWM95_2217 [Gemmatimonadetes bacterium]|nr:hypothetical protein [Gemmatimonadota bacterium]
MRSWLVTIAIALKVGDGVVLGADSASTLAAGSQVLNVYFNAEKVFNLCKGLPIGAVTYGLGSLQNRSIALLSKDLRERLSASGKWELKRNQFHVKDVVERMREFFYEERYKKEWPRQLTDPATGLERDVYAARGFMVAGYSAGQREAEVWTFEIDPSGTAAITELFPVGHTGIEAKGQPEALLRLMNGWSPRILEGLVASGIPLQDALTFLRSQAMEPLVQSGMPIQDAIDLVRYLIEVTAGFVRFIPGELSVHEPIDIAAVTYHEAFRWVRRKHYFSPELNPPSPGV